MILFAPEAIHGDFICLLFVQMVLLLLMHGSVNLLARLVHLLSTGQGNYLFAAVFSLSLFSPETIVLVVQQISFKLR